MRTPCSPLLGFAALGLVTLVAAGLSYAPVPSRAQGMPAMTTYQLGLLRKGTKWTAKRTPDTDSLQAGHMRNIRRMVDEGVLVAAGPFKNLGDLRGIYVFQADSIEKIRRLAERDPAIRAKRLALHLYSWYAPEGIGMLRDARSKQSGFKDSMVVHQFVLLKKGPKYTDQLTPELKELQARHVANVFGMIASGQAASAGPFWSSGDLAGVFIVRGDSANAHQLVRNDPAIAAGRLAFEIHPWLCAWGTFPGDTL